MYLRMCVCMYVCVDKLMAVLCGSLRFAVRLGSLIHACGHLVRMIKSLRLVFCDAVHHGSLRLVAVR